jgi:ABC-type transport system involved in multi-copper enzyme maturation permease subunit
MEPVRKLPEPDPDEAAVPWPLGAPPQAVLATVLWNEILRLRKTFRFSATALLLVFIMVLAAVTSAARFRSERAGQVGVLESYKRRLSAATVDQAVEMLHLAVRPAWRLSPIVEGGQAETPDAYAQALSALVPPQLWRTSTGNHRLPDPEPLDWTFVIGVVLSLGAFLLGYDAVCGGRRAGTLKLLLSYPVPRWQVFTGKLLAIWSCLAVPFLAGAAASLLIARLGGIPFLAQDLAKAGLVVLLGLWAAAFFTLLALFVSSLARNSSTSLSILAWLWVTMVIVVPAVSGLLVHRLRPLPTADEIGRESRAVNQRIDREFAGREEHWRPREWAAADNFAWERVSVAAENWRAALHEELRRRVLGAKIAQAQLARDLSSVSPASLTEDLAERLTGSGLWRDASFLEQAWAFRSALAERVRTLDAADPDSPHILFFNGYVSKQPLGREAIPSFVFHERSLQQGLRAAGPALALFLLETLALAAISLFFFSRCDVG